MGKNQSKLKSDVNYKKITTRRLKLGVKFGKDPDGGIGAGLACGYEKKWDRFIDDKIPLLEEMENK